MNQLYRRAALKFLQLPLIVGALVFLPAGTFDYWEAWLFTAVFFACSLAITVYLAIVDPNLLQSRMNAGPGAEKEPAQKIIVLFALLCFAAVPVVSALDHRFGWSHVPASVVLLGDAFIVLSYVGFLRRVPREQVRRGYDSGGGRAEGRLDRTVPFRSASDVQLCSDHDGRDAAGVGIMVGPCDAWADICSARRATAR